MSTLYDHEDIEIRALGIDVPAWVDPEITCGTVAAILQGGCASGAYMPAVTYWQALETMSEHGNAIIDYLEECLGDDLWAIPEEHRFWAGMACYFVSFAVELWASSIKDEAEEILEEIEGRLVEWSLSDDGTMDTVVEVTCRWCGESHEVRYSDAQDYRDEDTGELNEEEFSDMLTCEDFECPHCGAFA